jgi:hypothetical protein
MRGIAAMALREYFDDFCPRLAPTAKSRRQKQRLIKIHNLRVVRFGRTTWIDEDAELQRLQLALEPEPAERPVRRGRPRARA